MAYLELKNGKKVAISAEQGIKLWKTLHDPINLSDAQIDKLKTVKAVYLDWRTAPEAYIQENLAYIVPLALNEWCYTQQGKPSKPDNDWSWRFAKRWGLWEYGQPTILVTRGLVASPALSPPTNSLEVNN